LNIGPAIKPIRLEKIEIRHSNIRDRWRFIGAIVLFLTTNSKINGRKGIIIVKYTSTLKIGPCE
jgi:hypothetical protein